MEFEIVALYPFLLEILKTGFDGLFLSPFCARNLENGL
jgi:hypothetical protein